MRRKGSVARNALKGALAGAVATWVLDLVTTYIYEHEGRPEREREDRARAGRSAYESAAERVARLLDRELTFWAAVDEGMVTLLGLTPPPKAFPWQTHARGLAGHLAYGVAAEQTLRVLDAVA